MNTAQFSAAIGVVTAAIAWIGFLGGCTSFEQCRLHLKAPTPGDIHRANRSTAQLADELESICSMSSLQPLFARSTCHTRGLTQRQLADPEPVGALAALVITHSDAISGAIERASAAVAREGDQASEPYIAAYLRWNSARVLRLKALLAKQPTWQGLSRERRAMAWELEQTLAEIRS